MLLSDIISKPVITLSDGEMQGVVVNANFNDKLNRVTSLEVIGQTELNSEDELILDANSIFCIGTDAIIIKSADLTLKEITQIEKSNNPINALAYSVEGEFLGKITNVNLNDKLTVNNLLTLNCELKISDLTVFSKNVYLFNTKQIKIKRQVKKKFSPKVNLLQNVTSLPVITDKENVKIMDMSKDINILPTHTTATTNNILLGKKLIKTLQSTNGEIIARKDTVITQKILVQASKFNKLREMALNSK